jgi:hypothetical protein
MIKKPSKKDSGCLNRFEAHSLLLVRPFFFGVMIPQMNSPDGPKQKSLSQDVILFILKAHSHDDALFCPCLYVIFMESCSHSMFTRVNEGFAGDWFFLKRSFFRANMVDENFCLRQNSF